MDDLIILDNVLSDADDDDIIVPETFRIVAIYDYFHSNIDPIVSESFNLTLKYLDTLDNVDIIYDTETIPEMIPMGWSSASYYDFPRDFKQFIDVYQINRTYDEILDDALVGFANAVRDSFPVSTKNYHTFLNARTKTVNWFTNFLTENEYDAFVFPSSKRLPPKVGQSGAETNNQGQLAYTGFPVITVPGFKMINTPFDIGFEIASLYNHDKIIFQIAKLVENIRNTGGYQQFSYQISEI